MSMTITELEAQVLLLSPEDKLRLVDRLLTSLTPDSSIEEAWAVEVDRRLAEIDSGKVVPVPIEDAIARARAAIR